jgi:hypothetical protein
VFPVHLNPNVRAAIDAVMTRTFRSDSVNKRLFLIDPLDYQDTIYLVNCSYLILTDSGGIQEEAVSMGKPVLILRDNTERPEGVHAGAAVLVGSNVDTICRHVNSVLLDPRIYETMISSQQLYGDGHASERIVSILLQHSAHPSARALVSTFGKGQMPEPLPTLVSPIQQQIPALVLILTVWKRDTLSIICDMIFSQTIIPMFKTKIYIFQNSAYLNVSRDVETAKRRANKLGIEVVFMQSRVPTGYFGRFLVPLLSTGIKDSDYFIIFDDDIFFGKKYLQNMLRVVDDGFLATRNGRYILGDGSEGSFVNWDLYNTVTFEDDILYDFGGHMWAGTIAWLKAFWTFLPPSFETCEDFWISAVLRMHLGVNTKRPRCPKSDMEMCACAMPIALAHLPSEIGVSVGGSETRGKVLSSMMKHIHYRPVMHDVPGIFESEQRSYSYFKKGSGPFNINNTIFQSCVLWI